MLRQMARKTRELPRQGQRRRKARLVKVVARADKLGAALLLVGAAPAILE